MGFNISMNKNVLTLAIFSFLTILVWIGYTVYSNIFGTTDYASVYANIDQYTAPVNTNLYLSTLDKVNALAPNIKVPRSALTGVTLTPTPTPGQ
jgi:hypothetical protein